MKSTNKESIVYIGERKAVGKEWAGRRYTFPYGTAVQVPEEMAEFLLSTPNFIRADDANRTVDDLHPDGGRLLVRRWGALGDLILFRAAAAAFLRVRPNHKFVLRCQERFAPVFAEDPIWERVIASSVPFEGHGTFDGVITFDRTVEVDHHGDLRHRAVIFLAAMSMSPAVQITPEDWRLPIPDRAVNWVNRHLSARALLKEQRDMPLVAVQIRGSAAMKSLPQERVRELIRQVVDTPANVMLIEHHEHEAAKQMGHERVFSMPGRDALHVISLLSHCDLAVTMDSGALWMSHAAPCPVVCIMGPTRPEQRITMHPLYPDGARAVKLNDIISCPACFEQAKACRGKFSCMQDQPDWKVAIGAVMKEVREMLGISVSLPVVAGV